MLLNFWCFYGDVNKILLMDSFYVFFPVFFSTCVGEVCDLEDSFFLILNIFILKSDKISLIGF